MIAAIGRLCEKCDGKCVICDSYVRPCTLVRICDECNYGSYQGRCVICGGPGVSDAYYCKECTIQEKDVSEANRLLGARIVVLRTRALLKILLPSRSETVARKLWISAVPKRIYFTRGRSTASRSDNQLDHSRPCPSTAVISHFAYISLYSLLI